MATELEVHLTAMAEVHEKLLIWLARTVLATASPEQKEQMRQHVVGIAKRATYPQLPPALADHFADEVAELTDTLWTRIAAPLDKAP